MRLRRPCEHKDSVHPDGHYEPHEFGFDQYGYWGAERCPGGEFLPEDALVIEKVAGQWPDWAARAGMGFGVVDKLVKAKANAEALAADQVGELRE